MFLVGWSSCKKQRIRQPIGGTAMTELKCPKAIDLDWPSGSRMKETDGFELTGEGQLFRIKSMNTSVAEVANEQVAAESAKILGG